MSRTPERRGHPRIPFEVPVVIVEGSSVRSHTPRDLSAGGVYLHADVVPEVGSRVHAELVLGNDARFFADGVVVRADIDPSGLPRGFAVSFTEMDEATRARLAQAIAATRDDR